MEIICPKCEKGSLSLGGRACPVCNFPPTVEAALAHYTGKFAKPFNRFCVACCPACRSIYPGSATKCARCGRPLYSSLLFSLRYRFQQSTVIRFVVRWSFYAASAILFWRLLAYVESHQARRLIDWLKYAGLSVAYLAAAGILVRWIVPISVMRAITHRAPAGVKLSLVLNFFSGVLLLHIFVAAWWTRACLFAGLFGVVLVGGWVLTRMLFPTYQSSMAVMFGDAPVYHDTTVDQGRIIRYK